ncbi:hypothetical protein MMC28_007994 [Mycoblastus sanguinarius]|nr:hypothetical protein [Mycoblastus sanguinarius]
MTTLPDRPPSSTTTYTLTTSILALTIGYFICQASSSRLFSSSFSKSPSKSKKSWPNSWPNSYDVDIHPDSSDEELITHLDGGTEGLKEVKDCEEYEESSDENDRAESEENQEQQGELNTFEGNKEECNIVLLV